MWERFKRVIRSIMGAFISSVENPRMILEQNIRDMKDKIPVMNQGIAKARAGIIRIENEMTQYKQEIARLTARVKACLQSGEEGMAAEFAVKLKKTQEALERDEQQLTGAKAGYEALLKLKQRYQDEVKRKTEEALNAIRESEAAKWKAELADTFEQFEVAGVDATHDEMLDKLRGQSAEAEGRLAMAVESVDMKSIELEEKARKLEGQEILKQFKIELGMTDQKAAEGAGAGVEKATEKAEEKKTIGPERTKAQ